MNESRSYDDERITTFGRLVEAHAYLVNVLGREMEAETGIPLVWYGVLLHLGRTPGGYRPISELIDATAFTSGGVTRLVDRMEAAGLVVRQPCPNDRRVQYVVLTDAGRETLERGTEVHLRGIQEHLIDRLHADEVDVLGRLLAAIPDGAMSSGCGAEEIAG
jgi:MarR family 2-MHQ and catechol resistance regulon transcriptional repressor